MKRDVFRALLEWKDEPLRKPLVLRGARQVGKSWLVKEFSAQFEDFIEFNFERQPKLAQLFESDLSAQVILEKLSLHANKTITPGKTLLFLDEIQASEKALLALRYFKEECPDLHVIAAGSLLDFTLEKVGMPVGRVQFLYLYPLSFGEFLLASGKEKWRDYSAQNKFDSLLHDELIEQLQTYCWLGGMPAVVDAWIKYKDPLRCQDIQEELLASYRQDFIKYAKSKTELEKVDKVFAAIPQQLGDKFQYSRIDRDVRAAVLKEALFLLEKAGIAHIAYHTSAQGLPLAANKNEKKFKVFFFDIGLAQRLLGLDLASWQKEKLNVNYLGSMAEQFVAQEYIAYSSSKLPRELYYWHRDVKNSSAELDFIFVKQGKIIPVEVKSGAQGKLRSLRLFLDTYPHVKYGLKISEAKPHLHEKILSLPLYLIEGFLKATQDILPE